MIKKYICPVCYHLATKEDGFSCSRCNTAFIMCRHFVNVKEISDKFCLKCKGRFECYINNDLKQVNLLTFK
jgi:transcription elongation factor Elf1